MGKVLTPPMTSGVGHLAPRAAARPGDLPVELEAQDRNPDERLERLLRSWWLDERPAWTERDWWDAPLRDQVRALLWLPAGPLLATALGSIQGRGLCPSPHAGEALPGLPVPGHLNGWPCACMVVVSAAWEACAAWAAAGSATALVEAAGPEPLILDLRAATGQQLIDPAREELALALRTSPNSMANRIAAARDLVAQPPLLALVESAAISAWAARLVVLEIADLTPEHSRQVVDHVCMRVNQRLATGRRSWTSAEVGRAARMARRRLCPDSDRPTRAQAFSRRRVRVFRDKFGMASLVADLDETDAHRIQLRLAALARGLKAHEDGRTSDQLRADVLVDLLLSTPAQTPTESTGAMPEGGEASSPSGGSTTRPEIQVVVSLETLLGLAQDPAEVPGLGPIPAEAARELAADGRWRAWVADAGGTVMATGTRGYVPSSALARAVRAREQYCRMPGCRTSSLHCNLDHTVAYPAGATTAANLGPLCRRHHVLKTHVGWDLQPTEHPNASPGEGSSGPPAWRWRTPAGFTVPDHAYPPLE